MEPPGDRGTEPLGRGIGFSPRRPDVPIDATHKRGVRTAMVGEVEKLGEDAPRDCSEDVMRLESVKRQGKALVPPVVADASKNSGKGSAIRCGIFRPLKSAPGGSDGLAIAPELGQHRGQSVGGKSGVGVGLADLTGHELSPDVVSGKQVRDRDLAPRCDGPLAEELLLGLTQDLSCTSTGFDFFDELAWVLTGKIPEPTKRVVGIPLEPALLRDAHGTMVALVLRALAPRRAAHGLGERSASRLVVAEGLVLIGPVDVRRSDRQGVGPASGEDRAQTTQDAGSLDGCGATGALMEFPVHAVTVTRERTEAVLELYLPDRGDRGHGVGDVAGHVHVRPFTPEPLDLGHDLGQHRCGAAQAITDRGLVKVLGSTPGPEEPDRGRDVVDPSLAGGTDDGLPHAGVWLDAGLQETLLVKKQALVEATEENRQNVSHDTERKGLGGVGAGGIETCKHLASALRPMVVTNEISDVDDRLKERRQPLRIPAAPVERELETHEDCRSRPGEPVHQPRRAGAPGMAHLEWKGPAPVAVERRRKRGEAPAVSRKGLVGPDAELLDELGLVSDAEPSKNDGHESQVELGSRPASVGELEGGPGLAPEARGERRGPVREELALLGRESDGVAETVQSRQYMGGGELHAGGLLPGGAAAATVP